MTALVHVHIHGAGKVGRALAAGLRRAGWKVRLSSHRRDPSPLIRSRMVVLAVRDSELAEVARRWARDGRVAEGSVVLHTAGARTWWDLDPLRRQGTSVGQMHPLLSFIGGRQQVCWSGASMLVDGDAAAVAAGREIARALGMRPRSMPELDRAAYHASAALVAGGAAALVWAASTMLCRAAGVSRREAEKMLAPLLLSVTDNVERTGLPGALSGPIRRADAATLGEHLKAARRYAPQHEALVREVGRVQLGMAGELGEASVTALGQVKRLLDGRTAQRTRSKERPGVRDGKPGSLDRKDRSRL